MHFAIKFCIMLWVVIQVISAQAFNPAQSAISGIASGNNLLINQTYTIVVQAKDSSGNSLSTGGEEINLLITDPCTRGVNMVCIPSSFTQSATNGGKISQQFTDNGDGTYSTSFTLNHIGDATVSVVHVNNLGVSAKYYRSFSISGFPYYMNSLP
ncbi:unnamed protein product [Moneuplotes crassus]|uniref:Uncharacterized protein n=1 Tax=Euplotes crassus TaxID=5936 RepID=A0AAD1XI90_EUPCR|nr:unnamed protein product [Moneuplotes crassus]